MAKSNLSATPLPLRGKPPGSWAPARLLARRALAPVEHFLSIEAASGIMLLGAAAIALAWANSPWRDSYFALWHLPIGVTFGDFRFERDLHFWINDGVMTIFFFVVGLEIRREIHCGELSEPRRAALPLLAAVGGMLVPAAIYLGLNAGRPSAAGWGIPMATDIAFAVGVLTLLGKRVPPAVRILLLALAVIDDVGAILVIALFYSKGLSALGFVVAAAGLSGVLGMRLFGVRSPWLYVLPGVVAWAGTYASGIHPTLAGVALGLMTPVRAWLAKNTFVEQAAESASVLREHDVPEPEMLTHVERLNLVGQEAVSPVERLQHALHGWVAYGVMPLFALANAGVSLGSARFEGEPLLVFAGVVLGLVAGKPLGVVAFAWLGTRLGWATLPRGVTWPQVAVVGVVAGIGFTMSIFIAGLAFAPGLALETAKLGILLASGVSALLGYGLGRSLLGERHAADAAPTEAEAEASTVS